MFLNRLSEVQQGALLSFATQLMSADGKQAAEELALLKTLRQQMASTVSPVQVRSGDLPGMFASRSDRVALMLELLGMALVDAEYHETEQAFVSGIANSLDIGKEELSQMENWVRRQFALVREAEQFMEA
ncbi:hypothetical protein MasN3_31870 [Massilia varians]|uniref:Co-chaperone DjlA N-terminal domain-containing protein n=1 Tax=Massilia varians TaxID=457921 RepID=A0ABM8C8U9_9BURK|nr:TerB family tellurite resistance protein [Massilia varians]BDT59693.1 hypothetical protein MasN3_31870 [Massilia varians]